MESLLPSGVVRNLHYFGSPFIQNILTTMKLRVFIRVYGIPILLLIILLARLSLGMTTFSTFGKTLFFVSVAAAALLTDRRYVERFAIQGDRLVIISVNQFLQRKTDNFPLSEISDVKLSKRKSYALVWPPYFDFLIDSERRTYTVVSKNLYEHIQGQLAILQQEAGRVAKA